MDYTVALVGAKPTTFAGIRRQTTFDALGNVIVESLNTVYVFLKTAPVRQRGHNVVVYLDALRTVEIGVQVSSEFSSTDPILCSHTPGGLAAWAVHLGPYSALPNAHAAIRAWCAQNAKVLAGPNWEVYGDWDDDPQKLRTDVYYLLKDG